MRVAPGYGGSAYYRPYYYSFRPRVSLGFGLWMGYPLTYPYYPGYSYAYPYPYPSAAYPSAPYSGAYESPSYGYPAPGVAPYGSSSQRYPAGQPAQSLGVQGGGTQPGAGGVSFEIAPDTAAVFVDGVYAGTSGTFGPASQPLDLVPGRHHIEVRAPGFRSMTFDADVAPGQVIPFQGALQRQ